MGRIGAWFKKIGGKIKNGIHKAVTWVKDKVLPKIPIIGKVVSGIAGAIPHPIAQAVARGANVVSGVAAGVNNVVNGSGGGGS